MRLELTIDLDNDAFTESPDEARRILRKIASDVTQLRVGDHGTASDWNGNRVARWQIVAS